jgi:Ca-activated chloride channel family protein
MLKFGTVSFLWPSMLWLLSAVPLLALAYVGVAARQRRRAAVGVRLETVGEAAGRARLVRRRLPPLLWLTALALLTLAIARPQASIPLPARLETIVLAIDMSGSMRATDLAPTRLAAAQAAAKAFVAEQPSHVRIGVVAIAAAAAVVQSPTTRRDDIIQALERLEPQRGTALGSGLVIALDAALPRAGIDVDGFSNGKPRSRAADKKGAGEEKKAEQLAEPGSDRATAIVLLSDGQSNVGPEPLKAAELAADYGVRIYTVGIGTAEGVVVKSEGWSMRTRLDEESLKKVASITDGEYFRAADAGELKKIYRNLGIKLGMEKPKPTEVTAIVVALGTLLAAAAAGLSMLWFNRIL